MNWYLTLNTLRKGFEIFGPFKEESEAIDFLSGYQDGNPALTFEIFSSQEISPERAFREFKEWVESTQGVEV